MQSKLPAVRLFTKGLPLAAPTRVAYTADMQLDDFADVIEETRRLCAGLPSELVSTLPKNSHPGFVYSPARCVTNQCSTLPPILRPSARSLRVTTCGASTVAITPSLRRHWQQYDWLLGDTQHPLLCVCVWPAAPLERH